MLATTPSRILLPLAAAVMLALPASARAQAPTPPDHSVEDVLVFPTTEQSRRTFDQAEEDLRKAQEAQDRVRTERAGTQARTEILKSELQTVKKRLDLAKKEKNEGERLSLEKQRGEAEVQLRLLDRWRQVHDAAAKTAEAQKEVAQARRRTTEAEISLAEKRDERRVRLATDSTAVLTSMDDEVRRAIRRAIEFRRDEADKRRGFAERERDLAQQQLTLLDAQAAVRTLKR